MTTEIEQREIEVVAILNEKIKNDKSFAQRVEGTIIFYGSKFLNAIKKDGDEQGKVNEITQIIEDVILAQIFHGFFYQREMLRENDVLKENGEEPFYGEQFFNLPLGIMQAEMGSIMHHNFEENYYMRKENIAVDRKILNEYPLVFELYKTILLETCNFGAFLATVENESYNPFELPVQEDYLLGNPFDLNLLNPQIYMQQACLTPSLEMWDVFRMKNGTDTMPIWIGSIQLIKIQSALADLETVTEFYTLSCSISNLINESEKHNIFKYLYQQLPEDIQALTQIRGYDLEDAYIIDNEALV